MNLVKLFETQKILRDRIDYSEPDRFDKLVLALLVELGECANEWRGFKFWSKDQKPRTKKIKDGYFGLEDAIYTNPLLEEYVDILHFVLELGIELEIPELYGTEIKFVGLKNDVTNINDQFVKLFELSLLERPYTHSGDWLQLFEEFYILGEMLGFTWEQIEQAYYDKNKINHERQDSGVY